MWPLQFPGGYQMIGKCQMLQLFLYTWHFRSFINSSQLIKKWYPYVLAKIMKVQMPQGWPWTVKSPVQVWLPLLHVPHSLFILSYLSTAGYLIKAQHAQKQSQQCIINDNSKGTTVYIAIYIWWHGSLWSAEGSVCHISVDAFPLCGPTALIYSCMWAVFSGVPKFIFWTDYHHETCLQRVYFNICLRLLMCPWFSLLKILKISLCSPVMRETSFITHHGFICIVI